MEGKREVTPDYPHSTLILTPTLAIGIVYFGKTGPAINPMLGTTWAFYVSGMVR